MNLPVIREREDGVILTVRVQPRSRREEIVGINGDALKVVVRASPVDGAANTAVIKLLAKKVGVPPSSVVLVSGGKQRVKRIKFNGLTADELRLGLGEIIGSP